MNTLRQHLIPMLLARFQAVGRNFPPAVAPLYGACDEVTERKRLSWSLHCPAVWNDKWNRVPVLFVSALLIVLAKNPAYRDESKEAAELGGAN